MLRELFGLGGGHRSKRLLGSLICASLSLLLAACEDSEEIAAASEVSITASSMEGTVPLTVTFDLSSAATVMTASWDFDDGDTAQTIGEGSISHIFDEPGEHIVTVNVNLSRPSISTQEITLNINVLGDEDDPGPGGDGGSEPEVNLVLASFAIDNQLTPGSFETVSAIVQNLGPDELRGSGFIHVGYYLSTDDEITVDDILIGDTSIAIGDFFQPGDLTFGIDALAPGENYQFDHPLAVTNNVPAGVYYAGAIVDYIDDYDWYTFPRSTDTLEFVSPVNFIVAETDETDNARVLNAHQVTVTGPACADDMFEPDNSTGSATVIASGELQARNFCHDNVDWLQFDAVQGNVYAITTQLLGPEADTQLMLYDRDGSSILLYNDNILNTPFVTPCGEIYTAEFECGWPPNPASEIVWEALESGTYFIRVRLANCDEDLDLYCSSSPDGAGLDTEYTISLQ